jgi:hypothetical protein
MDPCRWLAAACLLLLVGCQAPVPATPTPLPPAPTAVRAAPTSAPVAPTVASQPTATSRPTAPAATASRVDTLNAANAAFKGGNLKDAAGLYDRVVNTPPGSAESASASSAINELAWFRGMVTLLADGREDAARVNLDALRQRDAASPLARLGDQLYNQYGMIGQLRGACAQLQPQVATQAGPTLATLQALGVTDVDATTLCSVPTG